MRQPVKRIPRACYYCGRSVANGSVCAACRTLYENDPLGGEAREPVSERELLADVKRAPRGPDQWSDAR